MTKKDYDFVVVGSGFGGSVSALRLAEKGYRVLVVEKGKWYKAEDFPKTNWQLSRWLWLPFLRWFGIMKITVFRHVGHRISPVEKPFAQKSSPPSLAPLASAAMRP